MYIHNIQILELTDSLYPLSFCLSIAYAIIDFLQLTTSSSTRVIEWRNWFRFWFRCRFTSRWRWRHLTQCQSSIQWRQRRRREASQSQPDATAQVLEPDKRIGPDRIGAVAGGLALPGPALHVAQSAAHQRYAQEAELAGRLQQRTEVPARWLGRRRRRWAGGVHIIIVVVVVVGGNGGNSRCNRPARAEQQVREHQRQWQRDQ